MTVTGSIGVITGKLSFGGFMEKLGINIEETAISPSGGISSIWRPYTGDERERVDLLIHDSYEMFVEHVANGRGMSVDDVDSVGQGRVWSGSDALENGLVDEIGGVTEAVRYAALAGGIEEGAPVTVRVYPEPSALGSLGGMGVLSFLGSDGLGVEMPEVDGVLYMAPIIVIE